MTKNELADAVAARTELSPAQARGVIDAMFSLVSDELARGAEVTLAGFGKFSVSHRAARVGLNPSTGATLAIPASRVPKFVAAADLKGRLNRHTSRGSQATSAAPRPAGKARASSPTLSSGTPGSTSGGGGTPSASAGPSVDRNDLRFLIAEGPETVPIGEVFSVLVRVALHGPGAELALAIPPDGLSLLLVAYAPGLDAKTETRQTLIVPPDRDSDPVLFEFAAPSPGAHRLKISAWNAGAFAGELNVEVLAEPHVASSTSREHRGRANLKGRDGAVALVVRSYPREGLYRFEFRDIDNPNEVTGALTYDPQAGVRRTIANLNALAGAKADYSPQATRKYLINAGIAMWEELLPEALREQFWARYDRIRELTIFTDNDIMPWELLYPIDPNNPKRDSGFLVERFPVMRGVFNHDPCSTLCLRPARFVLPEDSPAAAADEIDGIRRVLGVRKTKMTIVADFESLDRIVSDGAFGLLHFACHNDSSYGGGEGVIQIGGQAFTPLMLARARATRSLARRKPFVFVNACGSADASPRYTRLDGWAQAFLGAGAGAFTGSLWNVRDQSARQFAEAVYGLLTEGVELGEAVLQARRKGAQATGDPTWLAYSVYGESDARMSHHNTTAIH